jgi:pyruvate kinase
MTKIIATLGPVSENLNILQYFKANNVQIARINCSHDTPENQTKKGLTAKQAGLEVLMDMPGPKIRMGALEPINIKIGDKVILELEKVGVEYPHSRIVDGIDYEVLPTRVDLANFVKPGDDILIDDGKTHVVVDKSQYGSMYCTAVSNGLIKSGKGINLPISDVQIDFLTERDVYMMDGCLAQMRPEYLACSFVKNASEVERMRNLVREILVKNNITDYFPKICVKLEMGMALETETLTEIMDNCDMVMVARGDLALEAKPLHIAVPFLQDKIVAMAKEKGIPVIVATQMLESMLDVPVPTRAEVSDIYRAVNYNKADFIMLSAESASGNYPREAVKFMSDLIEYSKNN